MTTHSGSKQRLVGLAQIITATAEVLGHEVTPIAVEMMARDLLDYPDEQISAALQACRRELTGRLTLAAILDRIAVLDGHPEPNEAWAIALRASDENSSVAMTKQITVALHAAGPVLAAGDEIGARMAFIDRYKRELVEARGVREPVRWYLSAGHCPQGRADELARMKREGLIGDSELAAQLEHHAQAAQLPGPAVGAAVALITGRPASKQLTNAEQIERVKTLREFMLKKAAEIDAKREKEIQAVRDHHEALMARHQSLLEALEAKS